MATQPKKTITGGMKHDQSKPRMDLISPLAMAYLAHVLSFGAEKYEEHNWRKGIPISKLVAASSRHLEAIKAGILFDDETGLPHAAHLMCEAMFICEQMTASYWQENNDSFTLEEDQKQLLKELLAGNF
jgi:hypothetical protein